MTAVGRKVANWTEYSVASKAPHVTFVPIIHKTKLLVNFRKLVVSEINVQIDESSQICWDGSRQLV